MDRLGPGFPVSHRPACSCEQFSRHRLRCRRLFFPPRRIGGGHHDLAANGARGKPAVSCENGWRICCHVHHVGVHIGFDGGDVDLVVAELDDAAAEGERLAPEAGRVVSYELKPTEAHQQP